MLSLHSGRFFYSDPGLYDTGDAAPYVGDPVLRQFRGANNRAAGQNRAPADNFYEYMHYGWTQENSG